MKLLEHEAKHLLRESRLKVPQGILVDNKSYINLSYHKERYKEFFFNHKKVVIKAQIIGGKRKKQGLIKFADDYDVSLAMITSLYETVYKGNCIDQLLIEEQLTAEKEYFLSFQYDTTKRVVTILLSLFGGSDVEQEANRDSFVSYDIPCLEGLQDFACRNLAKKAGAKGQDILQLGSFIKKAYSCFMTYDCLSLEINPVIRTKEGFLFCGDAKIVVDDAAIARQVHFATVTDLENTWVLSEREQLARKIDHHDHRGVAGRTYLDFEEGTVAVLASGGGASLTCMDALISAGAMPANYTEYSGNPARDKVRALTRITLSKQGLLGCFVCGGRANFTDVFETLSGVMDGLDDTHPKPSYPIVIRRAGPRAKEAFDMVKKHAKEKGYDVVLLDEKTSLSESARIMAEKTEKYLMNMEDLHGHTHR